MNKKNYKKIEHLTSLVTSLDRNRSPLRILLILAFAVSAFAVTTGCKSLLDPEPEQVPQWWVPSTVALQGFGKATPWQGYWFTVVGKGTISPSCGATSPCFSGAGKYLCASGTLNGEPDFSAYGMVGWNLNQDELGGSPNLAVTKGKGLKIRVANPTNTPMRVLLQRYGNPNQSWCAQLPTGEGPHLMEWKQFNTNCQTNGGEAFSVGTQISQVSLVFTGTDKPTDFKFCVVEVGME